MNLPNDATTNPSPNLREQLERIGLTTVSAQLDDMLAHAAKLRWSPRQLLEQLAQIEAQQVPLAALWTFGGTQKDTYTVGVEGERSYQLQALTEANERIAAGK